jgi:hypothetical protein
VKHQKLASAAVEQNLCAAGDQKPSAAVEEKLASAAGEPVWEKTVVWVGREQTQTASGGKTVVQTVELVKQNQDPKLGISVSV